MKLRFILVFCTVLLSSACNVNPIEDLQSLCKEKDFVSVKNYIASNSQYKDDINAKLLEDVKSDADNMFSCVINNQVALLASGDVISEAIHMKRVEKIHQLVQSNNSGNVIFYLFKDNGEQAYEIFAELLDSNLVSALDLLTRMPQEVNPQIRNLLLERYRSQVIVNIALEKKRDKLIQQARREGNDTLVEELLKDDKEEMLKQSAAIGDTQTVNLLLKMGAHPNNGALYNAIESNATEVVKLLLEAGAKLQTVPQKMLLAPAHANNIDMLKMLIKADSSYVRNAIKKNEGALFSAIHNDNLDLVNLLLKYGANPNATSDSVSKKQTTTALNDAISQGNLSIVRILVKYGADVQLPNIYRESLVNANGYDSIKIQMAEKDGALVWSNTGTPERIIYASPLSIAYKYNEQDIVDFLLENGAHG